MSLTVKDFAKTLKISDKALLDRMQNAGLSHSKSSDEITASDKQALLKSLKGSKASSKSVTSESGVTVTSKGKASSTQTSGKSYSDNIEAKRAQASEQLKEQQVKREEQLKVAKQNQEQKKKKARKAQSPINENPIDVKDQLSSAVNAYKKKEGAATEEKHQFEVPSEFIKKDIEIPETINVGELAKLMAVKGLSLIHI